MIVNPGESSTHTVPHADPDEASNGADGEFAANTVPYHPTDSGPDSTLPRPAPEYHLVLRVGNARYRFLEKVHRSKMSQIWRATELAGGSSLAVKIVCRTSALTMDRAALSALVECSASPHLVRCIRHFLKGNYWYQLLEWLDGETLTARLRRDDGQTPVRTLERWLRQVGTGLATLHAAGIVHGDVKPDNIFIVDEQARLIDLSGQPLGAIPSRKVALTPSFACRGALKGAPAAPSDDVYAYALTALCVLTKRLAPPGDGFRRDRARPAGVSETQWRALRVALEPERADRRISIGELSSAIWMPPRHVVPTAIAPAREPRLVSAAPPAGRGRRGLRRLARRMRRKASYTVAASAGVALLVIALAARPPDTAGLEQGLPREGTVAASAAAAAGSPQQLTAQAMPGGPGGEAVSTERDPAFAARRFLSTESLIALAGLTTAEARPIEENSPGTLSPPVVTPAFAPSEPETTAEAATVASEPVLPSYEDTTATTESAPAIASATVELAGHEAEQEEDRDEAQSASRQDSAPAMSTMQAALGGGSALPTPRITPALATSDVVPPVLPVVAPDIPVMPDIPMPDVPAIVPAMPEIPVVNVPPTPDLALPGAPVIPDLPTRPEVPAARPDLPSGRPDLPNARPDVPTARPDVPTARPEIPPGRPDVPTGRPDIPRGRPDIPPGRPDIPPGRPGIG